MKRQLVVCAGWLVVYGILAVLLDVAGAPGWAWLAPPLAVLAGSQLYCRYLLPRRARELLLEQADPSIGPPHGATPADMPLIDQLGMHSDAKDYDALRSLLSDDFAIVEGRVILEAKDYVRSIRALDRQLPGTRTTDEVVVHPDEPDTVWVRSTASRKPRFGPGYVSTSWTRVTVSPDRTRVVSVVHAGVTHVT